MYVIVAYGISFCVDMLQVLIKKPNFKAHVYIYIYMFCKFVTFASYFHVDFFLLLCCFKVRTDAYILVVY